MRSQIIRFFKEKGEILFLNVCLIKKENVQQGIKYIFGLPSAPNPPVCDLCRFSHWLTLGLSLVTRAGEIREGLSLPLTLHSKAVGFSLWPPTHSKQDPMVTPPGCSAPAPNHLHSHLLIKVSVPHSCGTNASDIRKKTVGTTFQTWLSFFKYEDGGGAHKKE